MPKLNFLIAASRDLAPADDVAQAWVGKHVGDFVSADIKLQRSPEHNRMFWSVANKAHNNLPEHYASQWPDAHAMVKGLQIAFGFVEPVMMPKKGEEWEVVKIPKSLDFANMSQDEFTATSDKLFLGMAHCLGVEVEALLDERYAA